MQIFDMKDSTFKNFRKTKNDAVLKVPTVRSKGTSYYSYKHPELPLKSLLKRLYKDESAVE